MLISAVAFDLMDEAYRQGGLVATGAGFVGGVTVAAVFLSNVPEGLSSAVGMKRAGRGAAYVFGV